MKGEAPILKTPERALLPSLVQRLREELHAHLTFVRFAIVGGTFYLLYQVLLFVMYDSPLFWFLPAKDTSANLILLEHGDVRFLIVTLITSSLLTVGHFAALDLWTFRGKTSPGKPLLMRFGQFLATVSAAVVIVAVTVNVLTVQFDIYHFLAFPVGVCFAAVWNWLWASRFIWRRAKRGDARS